MLFQIFYSIVCFVMVVLSVPVYAENAASVNTNAIQLSSSDQMILRSIEKMDERINARFDKMNSEMNARFDKMNSEMNARFDKMNTRFDKMNSEMNVRFDNMNSEMNVRFEKMNTRFDNMNSEMNVRFDNMNSEMNVKFDNMNVRFDNLWIAMIGGFIGVMVFIASFVLWERKTYVQHAKIEVLKELADDKRKIDAMFEGYKNMRERFPEIETSMHAYGFA